MPHLTDFASWIWIGAMLLAWLLFVAVLGCAAVLAAWRQPSPPARHARPKSA